MVAVDPVPMRLRPPSNFQWRSDPHSVNGGGGDRLNPGGDVYAAYWMGRYLIQSANGFDNVSPRARDLPAPLPVEPAIAGDDSACGCRQAGAGGGSWLAVLAALALGSGVIRARRRAALPCEE